MGEKADHSQLNKVRDNNKAIHHSILKVNLLIDKSKHNLFIHHTRVNVVYM